MRPDAYCLRSHLAHIVLLPSKCRYSLKRDGDLLGRSTGVSRIWLCFIRKFWTMAQPLASTSSFIVKSSSHQDRTQDETCPLWRNKVAGLAGVTVMEDSQAHVKLTSGFASVPQHSASLKRKLSDRTGKGKKERQNSLRHVKNSTEVLRQRSAQTGGGTITPDGSSGGREGRKFTVGNVGNNGIIYLRYVICRLQTILPVMRGRCSNG